MKRKPEPSQNPWILIAEDDPQFLDALAARLSLEGFRVMKAAKLSEALIKLSNQRFDCLLLDLRFGNSSSESLIHQIRSDKSHFNFKTPILLMSGFLEKDLIVRVGREVTRFLVKPFDIEVMVSEVRLNKRAA